LDVIFTIVSRNYAAQAATLMDSLARMEPAARRVVVATDGPIPHLEGRAEVIEAQDLGAPLAAMSVYYDALELNTAVKPFVFKRLLSGAGVTSATYLDPDIVAFRPLDPVREGLGRAELVLTPHTTRPLLGDAQPGDRDLLRAGVYNLGFAAMRRADKTLGLLDWWAERCRFDCRVDLANGLFTDQKWMDLSPGFVDSVELIRDPGCNLAYWNLEGRALARAGDGWTVDGRPLVFFHFSGFDPNRPQTLSKHQNRLDVAPGSPLEELLRDFARTMLKNGHDETSGVPYAHSRFPSGRMLTGAMRRAALAAARRGEDFSAGLVPAVSDWFDAASPEAHLPGLPDVTRLMDAVWRDSAGADPFDRNTAEGRLGFHRWFADNAEALGADEIATAAAARLLAAAGEARRPDPSVWRDTPWTGPAAQALAWLREPAAAGPPRAVTALLAARDDLRRRFAADEQGLLAWCLGPEAAGGRFAVDLLPPARLEGLARDPAPLFAAARYADPAGNGNNLRRRLFAGFGVGARARWPAALVEPLRAVWLAPAPGLPAPFVQLFATLRDGRPDLQRLYPLDSAASRLRYLRWLVAGGLAEYGVEFAALPAAVRGHPLMRLAVASVRRRPAAAPPAARGRVPDLVVVEHSPDALRLPARALLYDVSIGRFRDAAGRPATAPRQASTVWFLTAPALVPADAVALHARGVAWTRAVGVWAPSAAPAPGEPGLGFVDEILSSQTLPPAARPAGVLDPGRPLHAALAALMAPGPG